MATLPTTTKAHREALPAAHRSLRSSPPARPALGALLLVVAVAVAPAAVAQGGFSLGARASTAGYGAEASVPLSASVRGRVALGTGSFGLELDSDRVTYEGDLDLATILAVADFHPTGGAFRLSVGALLNDSELVGDAPVSDVLFDQGIVLPFPVELGVVRARVDVEPVAPYLGIGWGAAPDSLRTRGLQLSLDLGVAWHGEPEVHLDLVTPIPIALIPGGQATLDRILEEEEQALQEEVADYQFYPVLGLTLAYRF